MMGCAGQRWLGGLTSSRLAVAVGRRCGGVANGFWNTKGRERNAKGAKVLGTLARWMQGRVPAGRAQSGEGAAVGLVNGWVAD
jgi:hypothetical protein